ncbi:methyltransferase family protein [Scopulibacillus darangshiensis]|uniref:Methyltransferase family protein n=1 Tax=Scopulibacillus darangshiensis TaxID=442528 RepID=A0A4R2P2H7_9BACL|nr:class I SAM-dependent methyltransferase [Scopulibacillus darangshiensis]TCP28890.1 methyltransferase family protein [Scopulibacillus darangshiensis]
MSKWFPKLYDKLMAPLEKKKLENIRRGLISKAEGHVLEIGSGTGANFPFYKNASHITAIEPNPNMIKESLPKINQTRVPIDIRQESAEVLPFKENTFDTVVGTLVFCTIPNPRQALNDIRRVLKPEGKFLLFEHVRMGNTTLSSLQNILTPVWKHLCDGCHLNRDTLKFVQESEFHVNNVTSYYNGLFLVIESTN